MNNQPAFPAPAGVAHITDQGMTLRDYFAAKAMEAMMHSKKTRENIAKYAYAMADEMMEATGE